MGLTLATVYTAEELFSCQTGLSRLPTISFCAFADVTTDRPSFLTLLLTYMGMRRNFVVEYVFQTMSNTEFRVFCDCGFPLGNEEFAVIKKMADVDFTTMLCEPELVMITARTVLFAHINLGINNIYLTNFMVLMLCLFGYLFKI